MVARPTGSVYAVPSSGSSSAAPSPYTSSGNITAGGPSAAAPVEEVRLGRTSDERERIELLANLYAIVNTLEYLERAFMNDIATDRYAAACSKLLTQYRVAAEALGPDASLDGFLATYSLQAPLAVKRIRSGVDATVEHGGATADDLGVQSQRILETAASFVTCLDMFALGSFTIDEMTPRLTEVLTGLNSIASLPPTFEGKVKLREWLSRLRAMPASGSLSADDSRQLQFDVTNAYQALHATLGINARK